MTEGFWHPYCQTETKYVARIRAPGTRKDLTGPTEAKLIGPIRNKNENLKNEKNLVNKSSNVP